MKEGNKKISKCFGLVTVAIIILSIFTVMTQYQVNDLTATIIDKDALPLVEIFVDESSGIVPFEVNFTSLVLNIVGHVKYHWDFGDGETSNEINPTHIYQWDGSFVCNLTVTDDSGEKASGSLVMSARLNQKPTVSIEADTDKPRRPKNFLLEYVLPLVIHIENFNSNDYRQLKKKGYLDPLLKGMNSFFSVEAFANDPDGDEIVSYNWTLRPPSYTTKIGKKPVDPVCHYSGKEVDIPAIDIYPSVEYSLILTVTDSAGEQRSENFKFTVQKSSDRVTFEGKKYMITNGIKNWVSQWHSNILIGGIILCGVTLILKFFNNNLPSVLSFPVGKLIFIVLAKLILQTDPDEYTDETYRDVIERIVHKPRLIFKHLPEKSKKRLDFVENVLEKLSEVDLLKQLKCAEFFANLSFFLQILEEDIGLDNKRPVISDPFPESDSANVPADCPQVTITVEDPEGNSFNVTIAGEYVNDVTYTDQHNGTFIATLTTPLPETREISWTVKVVDRNRKAGSYVDLDGEVFQSDEHKFKFKTLF